MAALPASVKYGYVKWYVIAAVADSTDPDTLPDAVAVSGTVTFTPMATPLLVQGVVDPVTIMQAPLTYTLNAQGRLVDAVGTPLITLVSNVNDSINPSGWNWQVSYDLNGGYSRGTFNFDLLDGQTVDLTEVAPVPSSGGASIVRGPRGYGFSGASVVGDDLVLHTADPDADDIVVGNVRGPQGPVGEVSQAEFDEAQAFVSTLAANQDNLGERTVNLENAPLVRRVIYANGSYPPRPVGVPAGYVEYVGPSQPVSWMTGDTWVPIA